MIRALLSAVVLVAAIAPTRPAPRPVRVLTTMAFKQFDETQRSQAMNALKRGLYQDSLIVQATKTDTIAPAFRRTVVIQGSFENQDRRVRVCLVLVNIFKQTITAPDTATVQYSELESALASLGARYARLLAQDPWPVPTFGPRCGSRTT